MSRLKQHPFLMFEMKTASRGLLAFAYDKNYDSIVSNKSFM